jgi:hypothetical protein
MDTTRHIPVPLCIALLASCRAATNVGGVQSGAVESAGGQALRAIDSTIVVVPPTVYTTRLNIARVDVTPDSLVVRLAVTTCRDTTRGPMFGGAGYDYVFRRVATRWLFESDVARGSGDGYCN